MKGVAIDEGNGDVLREARADCGLAAVCQLYGSEAFSETAPVTSFHRLKRETHQLAGPWMSATFENRSLDSP